MTESSTKPYLLRAIYEWCTDSGYTPYLAVMVDDTVQVPREYVKNGEIVLNVSALATSKLLMGNEYIEFQARFGGVARHIFVPVTHVAAIYAKETGNGMAFEVLLPSPQPADSEGVTPDIPRVPGQLSGVPNPMRPAGGEIKLIHQSPPETGARPDNAGDRPTRLASSRSGKTASGAILRNVDRPEKETESGTDKGTKSAAEKGTDKGADKGVDSGADKGPDNGPNKGPTGPTKGKPRLKIVK